jgi:hypothetical protein
MTELNTKKQASVNEARRTPAKRVKGKLVKTIHILDDDGQAIGAVDKATSLGNGYVLMKISTENTVPKLGGVRKTYVRQKTGELALKDAFEVADLPEIPRSFIQRLISYFETLNLARPPLRGTRRKSSLKRPGTPAKLASAPDPLAENKRFMEEMRAHEKINREKSLLSGALLKPAEFLEARGITRQSLSKAVKDSRIFYVAGDSRLRLYPAFFADPSNDRSGLELVSKELGDLPGACKWQFFTTKKLSLGSMTPVEAVKNGQLQKVLAAAAGFREQ